MLHRTFARFCAAVPGAIPAAVDTADLAGLDEQSAAAGRNDFINGFHDRAMVSPPTLHIMLGSSGHRHVTATVDLQPQTAPLCTTAYVLVDDDVDLTTHEDKVGKGGLVYLQERGPKRAAIVVSSSAAALNTTAKQEAALKELHAELAELKVERESVRTVIVPAPAVHLCFKDLRDNDSAAAIPWLRVLLEQFPKARLTVSSRAAGRLLDAEAFEGHRKEVIDQASTPVFKLLWPDLAGAFEALEWNGPCDGGRVDPVDAGDSISFLPQRHLRVAAESPFGQLVIDDAATDSLFVDAALGHTMPWMRHFGSHLPLGSRGRHRFAHLPLSTGTGALGPIGFLDVLPSVVSAGLRPRSLTSYSDFVSFLLRTQPQRLYTSAFGMSEQADELLELQRDILADYATVARKQALFLQQRSEELKTPMVSVAQSIAWERAASRLFRTCMFDRARDPFDPKPEDEALIGMKRRNPGDDSAEARAALEHSYLRRPLVDAQDVIRTEVTAAISGIALAAAAELDPGAWRVAAAEAKAHPAPVARAEPAPLRPQKHKRVFTTQELQAFLQEQVGDWAARVVREDAVDGPLFLAMSREDVATFFQAHAPDSDGISRIQEAHALQKKLARPGGDGPRAGSHPPKQDTSRGRSNFRGGRGRGGRGRGRGRG